MWAYTLWGLILEAFLRNFKLEQISFWLGFIAASLFWWLLRILRPRLSIFTHKLRDRIQTARQDINIRIEVNLINNTRRQAENLHLAAPLFSLSEIIIAPYLLAPPPNVEPGESPPPVDISEQVLPYLPDWPEIPATYGWPNLTLAEALQGGENLVITGQPGSGKTVTLADLAIKIPKREPLPGNINKFAPILVHTADLDLPHNDTENILQPLVNILSQTITGTKEEQLTSFLEKYIHENRILLLLDGLDELPPEPMQVVVDYLRHLLAQFSTLRVVVTASADFYDGLTALDFIPVPIAAWNDRKRLAFINKWSKLWIKHVRPQSEDQEQIDPVLLNAWLNNDKSTQTPLEQTLKVWSTYAGDTLGPTPNDAIEAYIRRMTVDGSIARQNLENLALNSVLSSLPIFTTQEAKDWKSAYETIVEEGSEAEQDLTQSSETITSYQEKPGKIKIADLITNLAEIGFLNTHHNSQYSFCNPIIQSYLVGCAERTRFFTNDLLKYSNWSTAIFSIGYLITQQRSVSSIIEYAKKSHAPLHKELLIAARWLRDIPESSEGYSQLMRLLADILQNESYSLGMRARALSALTRSRSTGVGVLFQKMITSTNPNHTVLAALGAGQIQDGKAVKDLISLLGDSKPNVRRAACLGLVAIGNSPALEAVAEALLHGDDDLRRLAAEALANNYEEGYPTLQEGADLDDLHLRRAVVYGLRRVNEPWASKILERLQVEDEQWVVKTAATHALEELSLLNPHIPHTIPPLTETPWLIAFAGERGIGVAPGKPALDLLLLALREGSEEQRLAALNYLNLHGDITTIPDALNTLNESKGELQDAAFNTLWHLSASGIQSPQTQ